MAIDESPRGASILLPWLVILLQNICDSMVGDNSEEHSVSDEGSAEPNPLDVHSTLIDMHTILSSILFDFRVHNSALLVDQDFGFWVLPRSTTWFSRFVMHEFDDRRWVQQFRLPKSAVVNLSQLLAPYIERQNTNYRQAVPALVRVACTLFKLAHGANLMICSEMFAIGRSTVSIVVRDVVRAINMELRDKISWPQGNKLLQGMRDFQAWCGLPGIVGAIDGTHFNIRKPAVGPEDYYYFKTGGYSIQCQAIVDRHKRFIDLSCGMPGSTNDVRCLKRSSLYRLATTTNHFDMAFAQDGFSPYLIGDKGYPLYPWLLTPYRDMGFGQRSLQERLFNKRLSKGRSVVENAFGILKHTFRELLVVSELSVVFLPDVVVACALLHNLLLGQSSEDVDRLMEVLVLEGMVPEVDDNPEVEPSPPGPPNHDYMVGAEKRTALGLFLAVQRNLV